MPTYLRHASSDALFRWRGQTMFLLPARDRAGEDISPTRRWLDRVGANVVREFGHVGWKDDYIPGVEALDYMRPWQTPGWDTWLRRHLAMHRDDGRRVEFCMLTGGLSGAESREFVQLCFDILAEFNGFHFAQVANEPEVNGIDVLGIMDGINRRGVVTDLGLDPLRVWFGENDPRNYRVPHAEYATSHDLARDFEHSPRNSKDAWEAAGVLGCPVVWDEPIGVIDPSRYPQYVDRGNGIWSLASGGGVRTTDIDIIVCGAAIADFYCPGYTVHLQCGLEGRAPGDDEPIQAGAAAAVCELAKFLPDDIYAGTYVRAGHGDFGLAYAPGDSRVDHAYGVVNGDVQYVCVPMPKPGWTPTPVNGWRIDAVGPVPYVLRLVK